MNRSVEVAVPDLERLIEKAPKAELHVHLRGAMPPDFFLKVLRKYTASKALESAPKRYMDAFRLCENIRPFLKSPDAAPIRTLFRYRSFDQFLATYLFTSYFCRNVSDFRDLVHAVRASLDSQNIVYAEITVSVFEYLNQGIDLGDLMEVLDETSAEPGKVRIQWIADLVRDIGPGKAMQLLRDILSVRPDSLAGVTLGGSEHKFPPAQFSDVYDLAREQGLGLTVHAGEATGPESVWDSIRVLRVDRVGHGVRSIEDQSLVDYLAENKTPLEVCPTSNIRTGVFSSYQEHSLPALYKAGVRVSVNTDDPGFFDTTLCAEYQRAHEMGLPEQDILAILRNGFSHAFLPERERQQYLAELDDHVQQFLGTKTEPESSE